MYTLYSTVYYHNVHLVNTAVPGCALLFYLPTWNRHTIIPGIFIAVRVVLMVHGDLPRQHSFGTILRFSGPVPADSLQ